METTLVIVDPVCGMHVDPASAVAVVYDGRTYYFCETACANTFRDDPHRWIAQDELAEA
jgi:Cu+-exporting ATPase